ncbi:MAG: flagellar motor switch phosphatase FliY [Defluviitaleaceae bacterium]|nr:flagellar motor switch phosphatase FliY [Defluviitaleaceae bacterium]
MGDMLSQDEINALLGGQESQGDDNTSSQDELLTSEQKDILGEVGNIAMGTAATTLSALLNRKVNITTPVVNIATWKEVSDRYSRPCVGVQIGYTVGLKGANLLILVNRDVKVISSLMMGGEGIGIDEDAELTELDLSAISEAMNQMIGSSCTSLATMIGEKIDIATPRAYQLDFSDEDFFSELLATESDKQLVTIAFNMTVGDLIDSQIMQAIPINFAIQMAQKIAGDSAAGFDEEQGEPSEPSESSFDEPILELSQPTPSTPKNTAPAPQPEIQYKEAGAPMMQQAPPRMAPNVNAQPVQFQDFDYGNVSQQKENIGILMDVPLDVSVELGKTSKKIKEILEFSPGTIIELDKLAGEPIDILVNGKYVAKGEVVVIDENFAIRVTSIISPELRI